MVGIKKSKYLLLVFIDVMLRVVLILICIIILLIALVILSFIHIQILVESVHFIICASNSALIKNLFHILVRIIQSFNII